MASTSAAAADNNPEVTTEEMDTTPVASFTPTNVTNNAKGSPPKTDDPTTKAVSAQSYREMTQVVKKINQNIVKLQEEVADLLIRWADTHLMAAILFDPEVEQIISDTQLVVIANAEFPQKPNLSEELKAKARAQAEARIAALKQEEAKFFAGKSAEEINKQYEEMYHDLEQSRTTSSKK